MTGIKNEIIKPIAVLGCICLAVAALLAYVNTVTLPVITQAAEEKAASARNEVLSEAQGEFEEVGTDLLDEETAQYVTEIYKASNGSGYVFMLSSKGYGGVIEMICGINADGELEQIQTLSNSETKGIGSRVVDNAEPYRQQYVGKTFEQLDEVDAVTGATISSNAYKKAVEQAFEAYKTVKGAE